MLENVATAALGKGAPVHAALAARRSADRRIRPRPDEWTTWWKYSVTAKSGGWKSRGPSPAIHCYLLLDEPAAGMNAGGDGIADRAARHAYPKVRGLGMLIIDHDMGLIMRLCASACTSLRPVGPLRKETAGRCAMIPPSSKPISAAVKPVMLDVEIPGSELRCRPGGARRFARRPHEGELVTLLGANGAGQVVYADGHRRCHTRGHCRTHSPE